MEYVKYMAKEGFVMTSKIVCAMHSQLQRKREEQHILIQKFGQVSNGGVISTNDTQSFLNAQLTN